MNANQAYDLMFEAAKIELRLVQGLSTSPHEIAAKETAIISLFQRCFRDLFTIIDCQMPDELEQLPLSLWCDHNAKRDISDAWLKLRFVSQLRRNGSTLDQAYEKVAEAFNISVEAVKKSYSRAKKSPDLMQRFDYDIDKTTLVVRAVDIFETLPTRSGRPKRTDSIVPNSGN